MEKGKNLYELLNASFQGVKRLFILAYTIAAGSDANQEAAIKGNKKYFLRRGKIENYNVLIDGRNFYDQSINDITKQYDEVKKSINRVWRWLYNWLLIGLCIFRRQLQTNCSRFK